MDFDKAKERVDREIKKAHEQEVLNQYRPLFNEVKKRADNHMEEERIDSIELSPGIPYNSPGEFWEKGEIIDIDQLPRIYQEHADSIAGQGDDRTHRTPTYHEAMQNAFDDFRGKVRNSLASVI